MLCLHYIFLMMHTYTKWLGVIVITYVQQLYVFEPIGGTSFRFSFEFQRRLDFSVCPLWPYILEIIAALTFLNCKYCELLFFKSIFYAWISSSRLLTTITYSVFFLFFSKILCGARFSTDHIQNSVTELLYFNFRTNTWDDSQWILFMCLD